MIDHNEMELQRQKLYHAVGNAIQAWSEVEHELACAFWLALNAKSLASTIAVFRAVVSSDAKIAMTHAAVLSAARNADEKEKWVKLRDRAKRRLTKRNLIAHMTMEVYQSSNPDHRVQWGGGSLVNIAALVTGDPPHAKRLTIKEINQDAESFRLLAKAIHDYTEQHLERFLEEQPQES